MKVVITGASGFIGQEVLNQCIRNPSVTSIIVLSRRQLPRPVESPKVRVIVLDDFLKYSESTIREIRGADACIWALGKPYISDMDEARRVSIDYTMAAARFFTENAAAREDRGARFRFVYLSGMAAQRDQTKSLWFLSDYRRIRGQVEAELIGHARENSAAFESYILRPGFVLGKEFSLRDVARSLASSVELDAVAKVTVDVSLNGFSGDTLENGDIVQRGNAVVTSP